MQLHLESYAELEGMVEVGSGMVVVGMELDLLARLVNGGRSCSPAATQCLSGLAGLVLVMLVHARKIRVIIHAPSKPRNAGMPAEGQERVSPRPCSFASLIISKCCIASDHDFWVFPKDDRQDFDRGEWVQRRGPLQ